MRMNNWRQNLLAFLLMFFSVLIDGFLMSYWTSSLEMSFGLMIPRTIVLMITLLSFHYDQKFMLSSAAFFGFLMDAYYLGFTGVYMASLLLISYIIINLRQAIHPNVLSYVLVSILSITIVEMIGFGIMKSLAITKISFQMFIVSRLGATLLLNGVIMLIFSYFLHQLIINVMDEY